MLLYIYKVPTGHQGRDSPTLTGTLKEGKNNNNNTTQHNAYIILQHQFVTLYIITAPI